MIQKFKYKEHDAERTLYVLHETATHTAGVDLDRAPENANEIIDAIIKGTFGGREEMLEYYEDGSEDKDPAKDTEYKTQMKEMFKFYRNFNKELMHPSK